MTKTTPIILDRMAEALSRHGLKLKRMQLLETAAAAFGYRNSHELAAADDAGDLAVPEARYMGRTRVDRIGWMHFFQDPDGTVFAIDQDRFDAQEGRGADWIVSPMGGLLDVSSLRRPAAIEDVAAREGREGGMYLGGSIPGFTNLCSEIAVPFTSGRPIDPESPAYMTSGCCEVATVTQEDLDELGLPYGEFDGSFYPLTDQEGGYIAEDLIDAADGIHGAFIGYSVLYRGRKHLMPTVEIANATDTEPQFPPRDEVLGEAQAYAGRIRPKIEAMGGAVLIDTCEHDRVNVQLLIPIEDAMAVGDFDAWKARLAWLMVDPALPTAPRDPVRHEGRSFAVEVSWIGEGEKGDYDPGDPDDVPLLRFDTQRRVEGRWEDVDDGSYCTQVPAYCDPRHARALARHLATRLDVEGGSHPKRLMEAMSWTDIATVKGAHAAQVEHDALMGADDDYVAHETYGNPDMGTSIDLRRRPDGSVRCEVYVDLSGTDVFEGANMAEVRAWLKTLESDIENADGPNQPSHALAPQWADDEDPEGGVRWMLVPADESEEDWFLETPTAAPFEHRFVTIDEMDV